MGLTTEDHVVYWLHSHTKPIIFFNPAPNSFHPTVSAAAERPTVVMSARRMTCRYVRFVFCNSTMQEGGIRPKLSLLSNNRRAMFSCKKNLPMRSRSRGCRYWYGKPKREILISERIYPSRRRNINWCFQSDYF